MVVLAFPFSSFVRLGVKLADSFTKDGQATITHEAYIGQDKFGKPIYATATHPRCVVSYKTRMIMSTSGQLITAISTLTFTTLPASNGASGRREPVDPRDRITLPDGFTGPIVYISGPLDPETGKGYILSVALGAR